MILARLEPMISTTLNTVCTVPLSLPHCDRCLIEVITGPLGHGNNTKSTTAVSDSQDSNIPQKQGAGGTWTDGSEVEVDT